MRAVHWFRNDLRLDDNTALAAAAARADELIPVFVLDPHLLTRPHASRPRWRFLLDCLARLAADLAARGCPLVVRHGNPLDEIPRLVGETQASLLTFNRDYTPYARRRDAALQARVEAAGVRVEAHKDRVVFEAPEVRKASGDGFVVYTPFRTAWMARYLKEPPPTAGSVRLPGPVAGVRSSHLPGPEPSRDGVARRYRPAARRRRRGGCAGSLSMRSRATGATATCRGSTRRRGCRRICASAPFRHADACATRWRGQPTTAPPRQARASGSTSSSGASSTSPCSPITRASSAAPSRTSSRACAGTTTMPASALVRGATGYPFVDAGMRQLVGTGWMHNRARMIVASFLTKDLLIDWRRGERFFMDHLIDGDPAANNGGWQWAASTGTDAQPYFRIFNPVLQGERFDPDGAYVRRYVPELADLPAKYLHRPWQAPSPPRNYPPPIVDHAERRLAAVARYEAARAEKR